MALLWLLPKKFNIFFLINIYILNLSNIWWTAFMVGLPLTFFFLFVWLQFPQHDLVLEAASPRLFVSGEGTYWDVPLSMAVDFSSTSSESGPSYHLCLQHNSGQPRSFSGGQSGEVPPALLPGFCAKAAVSIKKNADIWRKRGGKTKMLQPYDMFLCDPHISASGSIGKAFM